MKRGVVVLALAAGGCASLISADFDHAASGNAEDSGSLLDGAGAPLEGGGGTLTDGSVAPGTDGGMQTKKDSGGGGSGPACRQLVLPCLDPTDTKVIEVPGESTMQAAVMSAKAGDTIQINGASLGSGWRIPAYVTLRGCNGAKISGQVGVAGSGATFEGFQVTGTIVLNQTGVYLVHWNRFDGTGTDPGVSARSVDALVSAEVTATVEQNEFVARPAGIVGDTLYDNMIHSVDLTVQNNLFRDVASPILLTRGATMGKLTAKLLHNTLTGFNTGMGFYTLKDTPTVAGNIFASGTSAVSGDSPFTLSNSLLFNCAAGSATALGGAFATADPKLLDPANGDLHIGAGSAALDRVPAGPTLPSNDYAGCPRPVGHGGSSLGDIGAYEAP
jgi:hypothetical protein